MIKKVFAFTLSVLLLTIIGIRSAAAAEPSDNIGGQPEYTRSYVLMEVSTKTVVRSTSNAGERVHMGSLNKLMSVLLAAEAVQRGELSFESELSCSEHANSMQGAQIWLDIGERMTVRDLLKAVIIGNANDAVTVLAEGVSGSEESFVKLMNSRAAELGMTNTLFTNANGFYDDGQQYTTASDAALLLCELASHSEITDIFTTRLDELKNGAVSLVTTNTMCHSYKGSLGFKCGSGPESGYFAAEGAERDGVQFVAAVLGCADEDTALSLAQELLDTAFSGYTVAGLSVPDDVPESIAVELGVKEQLVLAVEDPSSAVIPVGREDDIVFQIILPDYVYAPVGKGDTVGELRLLLGEKVIRTCRITAAENVEGKNVKTVLAEILKKILCF